jgi:hypothetical protein
METCFNAPMSTADIQVWLHFGSDW